MISDSSFRQVFLRNCIIFKIRKGIVIHFRQLKLKTILWNFQTEEELNSYGILPIRKTGIFETKK
jgi:hypothetical protein